MTHEAPTPTAVTILGQTLRITCPPDEQDALIKSAEFLDKKMQDLRARSAVGNNERIAIMAALNIAHEYLNLQNNQQQATHLNEQINGLLNKVRTCLQSEPEQAAKTLALT